MVFQKFEKFLLLLLLLLLPSQLSYHFWPPWSLIHGIRIDYLSSTLYLTDLIIFSLFIISRFRVRVPFPVIIFAVLNFSISISPLNSLFHWLRLLEYFWLFKYLVSNIQDLASKISFPLSIALIWISLLAWTQFFLQRSLGGSLYWLGERSFNIGTPGIAKITLAGQLLLRPYATLPHPNALAGFLLVAGLIIYYLKNTTPPPPNLGGCWGVILGKTAIILATLTIPLTFSRTAIILEIVLLMIWIYFQISNYKLKILFLVTSTLILFNSSTLLPGSPDSLPLRLALNHKAILAIKQNWLSGVGLGNFIPATSRYSSFVIRNSFLVTQPVHNIYLLLASELGLPAFFVLSFMVIRSFRHLLSKNKYFIVPSLVILISGVVDHYWITLHQNILLLVIFLSLLKLQSMTKV